MYETLLNKYGVKQLGYYVEDIDVAAKHFRDALGAGPFIDSGATTTEKCVYRGKETVLTTRVAMGNLGDIQIELIQVLSEGDNVYTENGRYGFHHFCVWTEDLEAAIKEFEGLGFEIAVRMTNSGYDVVYFDCREAFGHYIEIVEPQADVYDGIKSLTEDWEGEPVLYGF